MICYLNNRFVPYAEAQLHVSDVGLQRGFGIFDYFISVNSRIPFLDDYLDRFFSSAFSLNLEAPLSRAELKEKIFFLTSENNPGKSAIKLLLTGGYSDDLYTPSTPNFLILNLPLSHHPDDFIGGIKLLLLDYIRFKPEIKTTFYLPTLSILPELRKQGALEVLYHSNGLVSETTRANIFLVKNNRLITPSEGILKGITRKHILKVAAGLMKIEERPVLLDEVLNADEVFITGTSKHVVPVVNIADHIIGNGQSGKLTLRLADAFREYYESQLLPGDSQ